MNETRQDDRTRKNPAKRLAMGLFPFIGIVAFVVAEAAWVLGGEGRSLLAGDGHRVMLVNGIVYLVGWMGIGAGFAHMFWGKKISASIGWDWSPFEWEVGVANLGMGIAGVMAGSFGKDYWLAVIIVVATFLWGAAIGHAREMIKAKNFAINNAGPIFFTDILIPAFLVVLYVTYPG